MSNLALRVVAQVAVLAALAVLVHRIFSLDQPQAALEGVGLSTIVVFVALMLLVRVIESWRWLYISRTVLGLTPLSLGFLTRVTLLAQFTTVLFFSTLGGEGVRVWKLGKQAGMSKRVPLAIVMDRIAGVAGLLVVAVPASIVFATQGPGLPEVSRAPAPLWGTIAVVCLVTGWALRRRWQGELVSSAVRLASSNHFLIVPVAISVLGYGVIVLAYGSLFLALGVNDPLGVLVVTIIPRFGRLVPISALGVGVVEGGTFVVGQVLGFPYQALLVLIAVHVISKYVAALLGAALELVSGGSTALRALFDPSSGSVAPTRVPSPLNQDLSPSSSGSEEG